MIDQDHHIIKLHQIITVIHRLQAKYRIFVTLDFLLLETLENMTKFVMLLYIFHRPYIFAWEKVEFGYSAYYIDQGFTTSVPQSGLQNLQTFGRFFRKFCENRLSWKKLQPIYLPKFSFEKVSFIYLRGETGTLFRSTSLVPLVTWELIRLTYQIILFLWKMTGYIVY